MTLVDPSHPLSKLLQEDRRYKLDAYLFILEALSYAHDQMGMGDLVNNHPSQSPNLAASVRNELSGTCRGNNSAKLQESMLLNSTVIWRGPC